MNKLFDIIYKIEKLFCGLAILVLTCFIVFDIMAREVFSLGLPWAQKSSVYLMIWAGFIGAALTSEKASHLRPEIADKLWGEKNKKLFIRLQNLFISVVCILLAYHSFNYVVQTKSFGDMGVVIKIPIWVLQIVLPWTFISMSLKHIRFIFCPELAIERYKGHS